MTLSDPTGLLQRMPELERIALEDSPVKAALGTGDPFKVYRALRWGSWTGRLRAHKDQVKELLGNRRLFARPLTGNPSLFTLNSFGLGFVGESERESDGTYITGHYLVMLFKLPLLPLGAYVVGPGDTATSYRIFARVPLGAFAWAWSRASALAAALLIASAGWGAFQDSRFATITVANGFKKPLEVELGGERLTVAPSTTAALVVPVGAQPARATLEGTVVDEGPIDVVSGLDAFVWNVGGVAPVFLVNVDYYAVPQSNAPEPSVQYLCGHRLIKQPDVDYFFREPERSVSMSKGQTMVRKLMLGADWTPGAERNPCISMLYLEGNEAGLRRTAATLQKVGQLGPGEETLPVFTSLLARVDEGAWEQAQALHQHHPDDLDTTDTWAWVAEETGHRDEAVAELEARRAQRPEDGDAAWLAQRAAPGTTTLAQWDALLQKFPRHDRIRRSVQAAAVREGDWKRAMGLWAERLDSQDRTACGDASLVAFAAVQLHRETAVLEALSGCGARADPDTVLPAVRLAMSIQQDPLPWLERLPNERQRQRVRMLAGLPIDPNDVQLKPMARFLTAAHQSGEALLSGLPALPALELQVMDREVALLVWAEAVRQQHAAAKTFARRARLSLRERNEMEAFITGAQPELDATHFSPDERAVAWLVRSRAAGLSPRDKERFRKLAREDGVQTGFVLSALDHWP